jgi:hypothetical protein
VARATWGASQAALATEQEAQVTLLRDIFNPFRPLPPFASAQPTADGLGLARRAYEERHLPSGHLLPARLALLADMLTDAGCNDAELLEHLRGPGPHVRGCWAVDAVLEKV